MRIRGRYRCTLFLPVDRKRNWEEARRGRRTFSSRQMNIEKEEVGRDHKRVSRVESYHSDTHSAFLLHPTQIWSAVRVWPPLIVFGLAMVYPVRPSPSRRSTFWSRTIQRSWDFRCDYTELDMIGHTPYWLWWTNPHLLTYPHHAQGSSRRRRRRLLRPPYSITPRHNIPEDERGSRKL